MKIKFICLLLIVSISGCAVKSKTNTDDSVSLMLGVYNPPLLPEAEKHFAKFNIKTKPDNLTKQDLESLLNLTSLIPNLNSYEIIEIKQSEKIM